MLSEFQIQQCPEATHYRTLKGKYNELQVKLTNCKNKLTKCKERHKIKTKYLQCLCAVQIVWSPGLRQDTRLLQSDTSGSHQCCRG